MQEARGSLAERAQITGAERLRLTKPDEARAHVTRRAVEGSPPGSRALDHASRGCGSGGQGVYIWRVRWS